MLNLLQAVKVYMKFKDVAPMELFKKHSIYLVKGKLFEVMLK